MPGTFRLILLFILFTASSGWSDSPTLAIEPIPSENGWAIVKKHRVSGRPLSVGRIGTELDPNERIAHQLYDGNADITTALYPFQMPVTGFVSAEFYESETGAPFARIRYRIAGRDLARIVRLKQVNVEALRRHVGGGVDGLQVTNTWVEVSTSTDLDTIGVRKKAEVLLFGNQSLSGYVLPTIENGSIYLALRDGSTRRIDSSEIERLVLKRSIAGQVMGSTFGQGIQGALTGGMTGLLAGLTFGGSVVEEMKFGAVVGGIVGLGIGFLDGVFSAEGSKTYEFRPAATPESFELMLTMGF